MATAYTEASGTQPYAYLTFTGSGSSSSMTYTWKLYYHASYAISTSSTKRISAWLGGSSGYGQALYQDYFNINGKTGDHLIAQGTKTISRTHSSQTVTGYVRIEFGSVNYGGVVLSTRNGEESVTIGAKPSYVVSYDANGGNGAPMSQTKWFNESLTLSATVPTRAGYNFLGWATNATATTPSYQPSSSYTGNGALSLFAVWELATVAPRIASMQTYHSEGEGTPSDTGNQLTVRATLTCAQESGEYVDTPFAIYIGNSDTPVITGTVAAEDSGEPNNVFKYFGTAYDYDVTYTATLVATYGQTSASASARAAARFYTLDFKAGGDGIGIGQRATSAGLHISMPTDHYSALRVNNYNVLTEYNVPDFVIATGTSTTGTQGSETSWEWVVWNSGKAECWGRSPSTTVSSWTLWDHYIYYSPVLGGAAFPTDFFASAPFYATVEFMASGNDAWLSYTDAATVSLAPKVYLYKPQNTTNTTGYFQYYARGTVSEDFPHGGGGGAIPDGDNMEYGSEE